MLQVLKILTEKTKSQLSLIMLHLDYVYQINDTLIDNAEDLDTVMPMYNLLEYSELLYDIRMFEELL